MTFKGMMQEVTALVVKKMAEEIKRKE